MVLLAAAICTKNGKALVSRQFVEMTRSRIEGLIASFPKLIGTGTKQHTFIETESVRYVYQPIDKLYMVLITTKASNILEDLETLRLFSRVIPEYCKTVEEKEIYEHNFELLFAFDEIVALGYRENVNLAQIRTYTDMESHEEKIYKSMREQQEKEAKMKAREKAEELRRIRVAEKASGIKSSFAQATSHYSSGFGSSNYQSTTSASFGGGSSNTIDNYDNPPTSSYSSSSSSSASKPNKAMKLGTSKDQLPAFIEQQVKQAMPTIQSNQSGASSSGSAGVGGDNKPNVDRVHLKIDEKVSMTCGKDGGVQNLEVLGVLFVRVAGEEDGKIRIALRNNDTRNLLLQTNPNVDKTLFKNQSVIGLKEASKSFPIGTDVGVLKWKFQTQDDTEIPLTINCWPSETKNGCDVSIEYELQKTGLELSNVAIVVPLPTNITPPIIKQCDGDYHYEKYKNILVWRMPTIDQSNATGSLEFSVTGSAHTADFFPVNVTFASKTSYCDIQVAGAVQAETGEPTKYSQEVSFSTEKYEIV